MICIGVNYFSIIATIVNFTLLFAIIILIYRAIQGVKKFVNRNKEMDKKIDIILDKLENKEDK